MGLGTYSFMYNTQSIVIIMLIMIILLVIAGKIGSKMENSNKKCVSYIGTKLTELHE